MSDNTKETIEFDVNMNAGILYDYMLYHIYRSPIGIIGTVVGMLLLANYFRGRELLYLIFGIIVVFYLPVNLYTSSKRQMLMVESYKSPLHYTLSEEGIRVSQGELDQGHEWGRVIKAVATSKSIFLYTGKNVATIFPRKDMGDQTESVIRMISRYVEPGKVKIRF
ncbi:MAG: YcxB family protein [Lachnospiraceae bacterium]|nr:YcxB family protein [Lachnospiraceae bacterium]